MSNQRLNVDLVNVMTVKFDEGALGTAGGTGNQKGTVCRVLVACEEGWIELDAIAHVGIIHRNSGGVEEIRYEEDAQRPLRHFTARNLVDVITGDAANGCPAEVGWRAVELLDAAYRSASQEGSFVTGESLYR
jgi:predicted dehydrogenase